MKHFSWRSRCAIGQTGPPTLEIDRWINFFVQLEYMSMWNREVLYPVGKTSSKKTGSKFNPLSFSNRLLLWKMFRPRKKSLVQGWMSWLLYCYRWWSNASEPLKGFDWRGCLTVRLAEECDDGSWRIWKGANIKLVGQGQWLWTILVG